VPSRAWESPGWTNPDGASERVSANLRSPIVGLSPGLKNGGGVYVAVDGGNEGSVADDADNQDLASYLKELSSGSDIFSDDFPHAIVVTNARPLVSIQPKLLGAENGLPFFKKSLLSDSS
jgi:hypothetical protein